jgi:hypothetical protein
MPGLPRQAHRFPVLGSGQMLARGHDALPQFHGEHGRIAQIWATKGLSDGTLMIFRSANLTQGSGEPPRSLLPVSKDRSAGSVLYELRLSSRSLDMVRFACKELDRNGNRTPPWRQSCPKRKTA